MGDNEVVLYLACNYMTVYVCQNLWNCTLKRVGFLYVKLYLNKIFKCKTCTHVQCTFCKNACKSQTLHLIECLPVSGGGGLEWGKGTEGNE